MTTVWLLYRDSGFGSQRLIDVFDAEPTFGLDYHSDEGDESNALWRFYVIKQTVRPTLQPISWRGE